MSIKDEAGAKFWTDSFGKETSVSLSLFQDKLTAAFSNNTKSFFEILIQYIICTSGEAKTVTVKEFDTFLHRFGPELSESIPKVKASFFDNGKLVAWYHGNISRERAEHIIKKHAESASDKQKNRHVPRSILRAISR